MTGTGLASFRREPGERRVVQVNKHAAVELVVGKRIVGARRVAFAIDKRVVPHVLVAETTRFQDRADGALKLHRRPSTIEEPMIVGDSWNRHGRSRNGRQRGQAGLHRPKVGMECGLRSRRTHRRRFDESRMGRRRSNAYVWFGSACARVYQRTVRLPSSPCTWLMGLYTNWVPAPLPPHNTPASFTRLPPTR